MGKFVQQIEPFFHRHLFRIANMLQMEGAREAHVEHFVLIMALVLAHPVYRNDVFDATKKRYSFIQDGFKQAP